MKICCLHKASKISHKYWHFRCGLNLISKLFCPEKDGLAFYLLDLHLSSFLRWSWVWLLGHRCNLTADCFWVQRSTASVLSRKDQPSRPFSKWSSLLVVPVCCYSYTFCTKGYFLFISLQLKFERSIAAFMCPHSLNRLLFKFLKS